MNIECILVSHFIRDEVCDNHGAREHYELKLVRPCLVHAQLFLVLTAMMSGCVVN